MVVCMASVNDNLQSGICVSRRCNVISPLSGTAHSNGQIYMKDAYRIVPIHPADPRFLAIMWQRQLFVDKQLPFGLASAPAIFSTIAEALEWVLQRRGVCHVLHYLDDSCCWGLQLFLNVSGLWTLPGPPARNRMFSWLQKRSVDLLHRCPSWASSWMQQCPFGHLVHASSYCYFCSHIYT